MGPGVAPLGVPLLLGCLRQGGQRPPVVALQLPNLRHSSHVSNASRGSNSPEPKHFGAAIPCHVTARQRT